MTDQEWCSVCSEPLTGEGFLLAPPWPEIQQCCSLACVQQIVMSESGRTTEVRTLHDGEHDEHISHPHYGDRCIVAGNDWRRENPEVCKYGDPCCPCQDGDPCHYEGENPMTPPDQHDILDRFAFHPATPTTGPLHDETRSNHRALAKFILASVPAGRHQSLALTALQESMMWSNAAIACDHPERVS